MTNPTRLLIVSLALLALQPASARAGLDIQATAAQVQSVRREVLDLVNEARSQRRRCGWKRFDAAPPLALSDALNRAALAHAQDMAERQILSHAGRDGSTPGDRATRSGYQWRAVGENIAAGQSTAEQVVADWLNSSHHCANLMDPGYSEMGVAFAVESQGEARIFWSQMFAAPRPTS